MITISIRLKFKSNLILILQNIKCVSLTIINVVSPKERIANPFDLS